MNSSFREYGPALRVSLDSTDLPAVKAALGQEGLVDGIDYRACPCCGRARRAQFAVVSGGQDLMPQKCTRQCESGFG